MRLYDTVRIVREVNGTKRELYRFPKIDPWKQVNAACLMLRNTEGGMKAARMIAEDMAAYLARSFQSRRQSWWIDQNSLFYTYKRLSAVPGIRLLNIEDVGMPFGSFDYSDVRVAGGASPVMTSAIIIQK